MNTDLNSLRVRIRRADTTGESQVPKFFPIVTYALEALLKIEICKKNTFIMLDIKSIPQLQIKLFCNNDYINYL